MGYSRACPDGTPHHRITGNRYISERLPEFFSTHPNRPGYDWQVCLKCGEAYECRADGAEGDLAPPVPARAGDPDAPPKSKRPGSYNMANKSTRVMNQYPGYVSTTLAASRLGVQRAQVREYIRNGELDGTQVVHRGSNVWLVTIESLARKLGRKYGEDLITGFLAGLEAAGFQLATNEAERPQDGGSNA